MKQMPDSEAERHAMASQNIGNALSLFLRRVCHLQFYSLGTFRHTLSATAWGQRTWSWENIGPIADDRRHGRILFAS